jgi:nucleotide-binding universal stress UspA family protein
MLTRSPETNVPVTQPVTLRSLVVPVDAMAASQRAVELAIRVAKLNPTQIVLVALLPPRRAADEFEPEEIEAMFMATERGLPAPVVIEPLDDEARVRERYDHVLLPLQKLVAAAGVPVTLRLLCGADLDRQLRELVAAETPGPALVLGNPLKLYRPLRKLTLELMADAPCTVYAAGIDAPRSRQPSFPERLLTRILQRASQLAVRRRESPADPGQGAQATE